MGVGVLIAPMMADVTLASVQILVGDPPAAWERLGFTVAADGIALEGARVRPVGDGDMLVEAPGLRAERPDGLAIVGGEREASVSAAAHPNGALALDHVVAVTDSLERTAGALTRAGLDLRRSSPPMAFLRLGPCILEVVERPGVATPLLWGLAMVVRDLGACAGPLLGSARDAVQPGRRIATVREAAGLSCAVALMTPRPQPGRAG